MQKQIVSGLKKLSLFTASLYLVACTSTNTPIKSDNPAESWAAHQVELKQINTFQVNGSLAYFSDKTKHYARFYLNQKSTNDYELKLTTPLGSSFMTLVAKPTYAQLIDQHGQKYNGQNVEQLLSQLTGMNIPLKSLHDWLIGLSDNPDSDKIDQYGRLKQTELQHNNINWQIVISSYTTKGKTDLPTQIELTHQDERIKLKMNNWTLMK